MGVISRRRRRTWSLTIKPQLSFQPLPSQGDRFLDHPSRVEIRKACIRMCDERSAQFVHPRTRTFELSILSHGLPMLVYIRARRAHSEGLSSFVLSLRLSGSTSSNDIDWSSY